MLGYQIAMHYDAYISYKVSDVSQDDVFSIYSPLIRAGMRLCTERFTSQLSEVAQIDDFVSASRRFVLLLTPKVFDSFWVWQEVLHLASDLASPLSSPLSSPLTRVWLTCLQVQSAIRFGTEFIFVLMDDTTWTVDGKQVTRPTVAMAEVALRSHCPEAPLPVQAAVRSLFGSGFESRVVRHSAVYDYSFELSLSRLCGTSIRTQKQLSQYGIGPQNAEMAEMLLDVIDLNRVAPASNTELRFVVESPGDASSVRVAEVVPVREHAARPAIPRTLRQGAFHTHTSRALCGALQTICLTELTAVCMCCRRTVGCSDG